MRFKFLYTNRNSHYFSILNLSQIRKKAAFTAVIIMLIPFVLKAEWVPLNKNNAIQKPPDVTLISEDNTSTILKIEISGFELTNFSTGNQNYQMIDLLSESFTTKPGSPELPYIARILAIPDRADVSIEVLEKGEIQSFTNIVLPPARESWLEGSPESPYNENSIVYNSIKSYPGKFAQSDHPSVFRDFRITRVSVFPIQYFPAKKELQVVNSITIRINFDENGEAANPKNSQRRPIAPSFGKLYRSTIFNYQNVLDDLYGGKENGHDLMLCIMPDDFYEGFEIYADWKRRSGVDIHMTKFSDIGANATDPNIIKNHIADAYLNWEVPPTYVLLVGDDGVLPIFTGGFADENHFVEIEGNDYFPEMMIGRFTNQSSYQMQVMINKFLLYEKTPYTANTDWFKKGICCSNDAYISQVETKRFAAQVMRDDGGFTSVDTMMSDPGCTYNVSDVVNAINEGRSYLNYRGEGWSSGWWASCTPMHTPDVSNLANDQKFTFVTSIGCGVAMFDGGGNCFGEEWVELGTISNPRGAAAFIGPTGNTHTTYNNKIDKGIYVGMFQEGMDTPGQALVRGKLYMYNVYGNEYYVEYHYKIYCVLGDPSIHIWKDVPLAVTVDYPVSVPFGNSTVEFTVTHSATGQPVSNALVCVTGNTQFATDSTNESGIAYVDVEAEELETFNVTVRGGNVIPFEGTLVVAPPTGPYIINESYIINDVSGGNGNGLMDYGETNLLSLTMINIGVEQAENVVVNINTDNPYITITDSIADYGSIASGDTAVVTDGFAYSVANNIPDIEEVSFTVTATNGSDSWESFVLIEACAPVLSVGMLTISDPDGNNNGLLDPGETDTITITVSNIGHSLSPNATAYLYSANSFITLNNTSDDLGTIDIGATVDASFSVSVSPSAPVGESVDIDFDVTAGEYNASKSFVASIGLIIEDWETGDFNKFPWTMGGSADWTIETNNPYEGIYCAKSGNIVDSQVSNMEVTINITSDGEITFFRKVSSENGWDYLRFFIDGYQVDEWSGNVAWGQESFSVNAGVHTFKWEYYKDGSVSSGSDCAWIDYIIFPVTVFEASFSSDQTNICEGESVSFYDQSSGNAISWDWVFEGGTPATSTLQNPVIEYSTSGIYDVSLIVFNGVANDTLTIENYITVSVLPETAPTPLGPESVCGTSESTSYSTTGLTGVSVYEWILEPSDAGNVSGTSLTSTIFWENEFLGEASLKVAGENICGTGNYSDPINITRYLPEVALEPFEWVCLDWPAFELSGGMPEGGEYSGTGVEYGWFYPAEAGTGTHTITYTYTNPEECENFATETILVDPCTGINDPANLSGIVIYPNPTTGILNIDFDQNTGPTEIIVVNTLNDVVYSYSSETLTGKKLNIDLSKLGKGIYFIKIKTDTLEKTTKVVLW